MPDIHWGYGFPIGGVAATDPETGVISPGGVGYDINCGVRLALFDEPYSELGQKARGRLLEAIFRRVPSGVGKGHRGMRKLSAALEDELGLDLTGWTLERISSVSPNGTIAGIGTNPSGQQEAWVATIPFFGPSNQQILARSMF